MHEQKQADYVGSNPDTLASFRASANLLGVSVSQLILGRCMDKVIRMSILLRREGYDPAVADESVRDTALDLAVYGALLVESIDDKIGTKQLPLLEPESFKPAPLQFSDKIVKRKNLFGETSKEYIHAD